MKFWWTRFRDYLVRVRDYSDWREAFDEDKAKIRRVFSDFLFDIEGAENQNDFVFDGELECGEPAPKILVIIYKRSTNLD